MQRELVFIMVVPAALAMAVTASTLTTRAGLAAITSRNDSTILGRDDMQLGASPCS